MYKKILAWGIVYMVLFFGGIILAGNWDLPGVTIITRAQWGANENLRYSKYSAKELKARLNEKHQQELEELQNTNMDAYLDRKRQEYEKQMANDYLISNYASEHTIDEIRYEHLGNYLKRPEAIHKKKTKIIIHHTAGDYSELLTGGEEAVKKYLQDVYKYHALIRGRGDIGYNFLIDPFGNIYEGRAGGEGVIGAQTAWNNIPSIGIALMGNFNIQQPTEAQLKSLIKLSAALAKKYKIDPESRVIYFEKSSEVPYIKENENFSIIGHKDAGKTSCPGTYLYDLLPEIRSQVKKEISKIRLTSTRIFRNRTNTGINKNIDTIKPFQNANLGEQLPGLYYSAKQTDTFFLPLTIKNLKNCSGVDDTFVVDDCSIENDKIKISLTKKKFASGIKSIKINTDNEEKIISFKIWRQEDLDILINGFKNNYIKYRFLTSPDTAINKITYKITLDEVKKYVNANIKVLLYDLSTNYNVRNISCEGKCIINADGKIYTDENPIIESHDGFLYLTIENNVYGPEKITVTSSKKNGLITFTKYKRSSYAKIPWNTFRGSIIFAKEKIKNIKSNQYEEKYVVINELPFNDYMKGIAETSEQEHKEKIKLMALLAKTYALFYMNPANKHPSIPEGASYTAIDSPDMFQKYVGAGAEKTLKKYQSILKEIQNQVLLYDGYVPILPYFTCSAGFTFSAREKWGWVDTPYLVSRYDQEKCIDFQGHGVGLSGKGAQYLANQGWNSAQILEYYYPGVQVKVVD